MKPRVLIVCNAIDDVVRQQRGITTDSPAATRKIFMLCQALRLAGVRPLIISLGRGRAGGGGDFFSSIFRRIDGVPIFYAPFSKIRFLSELISLLAPLGIILKLRCQNPKAVIYYNRMTAYIPTLFFSSLLGYINILDLEDGDASLSSRSNMNFFRKIVPRLFDRLCKGGALIACNKLAEQTTSRPVFSYYGTAVEESATNKWQSGCVNVLMGGTLSLDTGAELLIDAIRQMRLNADSWTSNLNIQVTGYGPSLERLVILATEPGFPKVVVHGRTTDSQYRKVLRYCNVGLALKLNDGPLANTTFPSKVIEFAASGLLVLSTDISDVRQVFGSGALYLTRDEPKALIDLFEIIVKNRLMAQECAQKGSSTVLALCTPHSSGVAIKDFIFNDAI